MTTSTQPPQSTDKTVLVTGANGYLALHVIHLLLQHGHTVRGSSRSISAKETILSSTIFEPYINATPSRYEHVIVPDMTVPGAFDEAIKDVYSVIHIASPVDFSLKTVDEFIKPAVGGVTSILTSILNLQQTNPEHFNFQSFVLTSSIAAVVDRWAHPDPSTTNNQTSIHHYTEQDWNNNSERVAREAESQDSSTPFPAPVAYGASKTAAERALWTFRKTNPSLASQVSFSAINPGVITGPPLLYPSTPSGLNETLKPIWRIFANSNNMASLPSPIGTASYIDVRDVAMMHVFCAEHPDLVNAERYLLTNGKAPPQAIADVLWDAFSDRRNAASGWIKWQDTRGQGYVEGSFEFPKGENSTVANKARGVLSRAGMNDESVFRTFDRSVLDTVRGFLEEWPDLVQ